MCTFLLQALCIYSQRLQTPRHKATQSTPSSCRRKSSSSTSIWLMRFLVNSNAVKKIALTTQERDMETPKPVDVSLMKDSQLCARHTSIHPWIEKLNLWSRLLVFAAYKAVALIDTLSGIDWKNLSCISATVFSHKGELTQAQLTRPHSPPATTTARGCVGEVPRALARICFTLSYVTK